VPAANGTWRVPWGVIWKLQTMRDVPGAQYLTAIVHWPAGCPPPALFLGGWIRASPAEIALLCRAVENKEIKFVKAKKPVRHRPGDGLCARHLELRRVCWPGWFSPRQVKELFEQQKNSGEIVMLDRSGLFARRQDAQEGLPALHEGQAALEIPRSALHARSEGPRGWCSRLRV